MAIIGILGSQYLATLEKPFGWNRVDYTRQSFIRALHALGHRVVILPVDAPTEAAEEIRLVDKLLLTGGDDISPEYYGEEPHPLLGATNPERDAFEIAAVKAAMTFGKAIFGVCRGLQLINVALGGSLYQDLSLSPATLKHWQSPTQQQFATHHVSIVPDSQLGFLPTSYKVNSFHHQAVKVLASGLTAIGQASDGIVEAVESRELRILSVQWHPESRFAVEPLDLEIFRFFAKSL